MTEAYADFSKAESLMVCSMGISCEVPLVNSALGMVQAGSPVTYHQPAAAQRDMSFHLAPPSPSLPLEGYHLEPSVHMSETTEAERRHLQSLQVTWDMANTLERATRSQSSCEEWHQLRRPRLTTSRFREICFVSNKCEGSLADRILKGTHQTKAMRRGLELEADAIWEYTQIKRVNHYPCGFIIHPDTPWLGATPDGLVFDPTEPTPFGLLEIKCPNIKNYVDCPYVKMNLGNMELKRSHAYYYQVQGQLLVSGMTWCDFVVSAEEDTLIDRIYRDTEVFKVIRDKVDRFYFHVYMRKCL